MNNIFYNAHHSPIGAFASFTLGYKGKSGGFGLEIGGPANQQLYIGLESRRENLLEALPFFAEATDERVRYDIKNRSDQLDHVVTLPFPDENIERDFKVATDTWKSGDLTMSIFSPVMSAPNPFIAPEEDSQLAYVPSIIVEFTIDNTGCNRNRKLFFAFEGNDPYTGMRRLDNLTAGEIKGVGQGRHYAIATRDDNAYSGISFGLNDLVFPSWEENLQCGTSGTSGLVWNVPSNSKATYRCAICFFKDGVVTANLETVYWYTNYFKSIEEVARFTLDNFDLLKNRAFEADKKIDSSALSSNQKFMLSHAIRSYYGSTELLSDKGCPLWIVNEGEYRMINTFDLTVDHLFYEMATNPWTIRNVLDFYVDRYSYRDRVHFPGEEETHEGGLSFVHDMGASNVFSRPGYSSYERFKIDGCFSHMTHEQLVNWVLCGAVYWARTKDNGWLNKRLNVFIDCFQSMLNRDHPDPEKRNGIMGLDSDRTRGGSEITTYDSLDTSLGQARNNIYLAVKCWSAYVALAKIFESKGLPDLAISAEDQANRCAATLIKAMKPEGFIPAVIDGSSDSKIIPAIEGLVFPWFMGFHEAIDKNGVFGEFITILEKHLVTVLKPGECLFEDGGWKLSSTSDNSWLSKIYLCQFVRRKVFGLSQDETGERADQAHVDWLLDNRNGYFAWSDQIVAGEARGSKYYPRGVTAALWLME